MHSFFRTARPFLFFSPTRRFFTSRSSLAYAVPAAASPTMASPIIKVHNSLTPGGPVPFEPKEKGNVSWYACGPTVYDQSHLGHARNYVSTDIIRRIFMHYFDYKVKFVMNITDIDDKIIIRARRQRLLDLEKKKTYTPEELHALGAKAFLAYAQSNLPLLVEGEGLDEKNYEERRDKAYGGVLAGGALTADGKPGDAEAKIKMHLSNMDAAAKGLRDGKVFGSADEVLLPYLDSLYKETIDTSDQSMFTDLTRRMEADFFDDMDNLNNLRPDEITRVTEYVPQIADFVDRIVKKGFAYESQGSVYFDIAAFEKAGNTYARLKPESRGDKALQEEGEGSLSKGAGGKRSPGDFALWKQSKPGEPYWPSPWGNGRPGWHIECSVMASDRLGAQMDVHSGGIDLAFPHHDNELAQSEAYFCEHGKGEHTWVKYFLHMGHLSISGSKMSKSLKNFQTIKDALATTYSARNLRIVFMMGRWNEGVEISPELRVQADSWENTVNQFFTNTKSWLAEAGVASTNDGLESLFISDDAAQQGLLADLGQAKRDTEAFLANSFDTNGALRTIADLINKVNVHKREHKSDADLAAIERIARWVTRMVGIFGLDANAKPPYNGLGWVSDPSAGLDLEAVRTTYASVRDEIKASGFAESVIAVLDTQNPASDVQKLQDSGVTDPERLAYPFVDAVAKLRDELRRTVSSAASAEQKKAILALSDRIRDHDLTNLGVYLDDRPDGQPSLIKFVPAAQLIAAREEKAAQQAAKERAKEEARLEKERKEQERWAKAAVKPQDMYRAETDKYSEFDDEGIPTKMKDGSEVTKSAAKKLKKDWEKQKKLHEEYVKKFGGS
ncbi:hypothetical protein PpBr36_03238 [Pyricularia pennisetigena]|uniref:hypothetical protein n=1 Tax=Pyricularia pennisetigena TaxID=1578925 RepID=UPI00114D5797|nr:hypothetical protein PpBr36_03238 [Pyricularia pennisetigena]TLS30253.1 hypothetical protein PpBr36_03238 [Pyricularia pennisetigena]